ncbi:phage tail protein, partial [Paenibacillus alvei]
MSYKRTEWVDHIVSPTGEVLQEGTPISAANLNKIEEGIEKLSTDLGNIKVPPASLQEPGIVQLSNATNSTDETMAATPKAVHDVNQAVKENKTSIDSHVTDTTKHVTVDERTAWNSKAPASHKHDASDITAGTMAAARLPSASVSAAGIVQLSTATNGTR